MPDLATLYRVIDDTWPAAAFRDCGPWKLRQGGGGGQRVSAATAEGAFSEAELPAAEAAMREMGQTPLFMIRAGEAALDAMLEQAGYQIVDPVNLYLAPIEPLAKPDIPRALVFAIWPPLAIQKDIWAEGGIGPDRVAVMERAEAPKVSVLGRYDQTAAATCYAAISHSTAMIHALEVAETCRRKGVGVMMTEHVARWGMKHGATHIATLCTQANAGANALYTSMGMEVVGQYHYRKLLRDQLK